MTTHTMLVVPPWTPDERRLDLDLEGGARLPASEVSTGVRLMIYFVTLAYHPAPPDLLRIEEPENGVHPKRLKEIVTLLRDIASGRHGGKAAQVILTTHSPYLLDEVRLEENDQVLVFQRLQGGKRIVEPADKERLTRFLGEFMLGEVWFNQDEAGLVKKAG